MLDGVDVTVAPGEFLAVMGASGSGKSTLLTMLSGMDRPTSGTVVLDGADLTAASEAEQGRIRLTRMGFVFQQAHLLENLSLRDNVLLPAWTAAPRGRRGRAERAAAGARVDALLARFGIDHVGDHAITEVSGGQLQRAALCRALVNDPAVIFADEPTGALNSRATGEVMDALSQVHADGATIVMVTHDPAVAARADRVLYLRDGAVVAELAPGPWSAAAHTAREDQLLAWLRDQGF